MGTTRNNSENENEWWLRISEAGFQHRSFITPRVVVGFLGFFFIASASSQVKSRVFFYSYPSQPDVPSSRSKAFLGSEPGRADYKLATKGTIKSLLRPLAVPEAPSTFCELPPLGRRESWSLDLT